METGLRRILVSSEKPQKLEGHVIYFVLNGGRAVEVFSEQPFSYKNFAIASTPEMTVSKVTNYVGDGSGYWHVPVRQVLDTLVEKNPVQVESANEDLRTAFQKRAG